MKITVEVPDSVADEAKARFESMAAHYAERVQRNKLMTDMRAAKTPAERAAARTAMRALHDEMRAKRAPKAPKNEVAPRSNK